MTWEKAALSEWELLLQRKGYCSKIGKICKIMISSEWIRKSRPYPTPLLIMPCSCTRRRLKWSFWTEGNLNPLFWMTFVIIELGDTAVRNGWKEDFRILVRYCKLKTILTLWTSITPVTMLCLILLPGKVLLDILTWKLLTQKTLQPEDSWDHTVNILKLRKE